MFVPMPTSSVRCSRCGLIKPSSAFAWRRRDIGQLDTYRRPCRAEYKREHYLANRERYVAAAAVRRQHRSENRPGSSWGTSEATRVQTGETDALVLEFHLGEKEFNVSAGLRNRNCQAVLREMDKCEVVCANCHRRRTARRGGFARAAAAQAASFGTEPGCA